MEDYYPFGMVAINSRATKTKKNEYLFNGYELLNQFLLNIYQTEFRTFDPSIGRWHQLDPKLSERESPYVGFSDNPIKFIDPLGDTTEYYNIETGQLLGIINNEGNYSRIKVNASSFGTGVISALTSSEIDISTQEGANWLVNTINENALKHGAKTGTRSILRESGLEMEFSGASENSSDVVTSSNVTEYYANGTLSTYSVFEDGSRVLLSSLNARSGPWGNGPLPNGNYAASGIVNTNESGMVRDGVGFKIILNDNTIYNRTALRIHPDQVPSVGTSGCIGLVSGSNGLSNLRTVVRRFFRSYQNGTFNVDVDIQNNPNYSGSGSNTILGE
jgi:RHS repeat-associated protein